MSGQPQAHADEELRDKTAQPQAADAQPDSIEVTDAEAAAPRPEEAVSDRARARQLFAEMAALPEGSPERQAIRDALVETHLPLVEYLARRFRNRGELHDDLVQVALERALRHLDQWQPGTRLDSWLFRIMKNAWIDEVRARARRDDVLAPEEAGEHVGVDERDAQVARLSVASAMARLPGEQRLAVSLVLVEGLPYKDAAAVLEVPVGTLTSRLARGREALQALLGGAA